MQALNKQLARARSGCHQRSITSIGRHQVKLHVVRNARITTRATAAPAQPAAAAFTPSELVKVIFPDDDTQDQLDKDVVADICYPTKNNTPVTPVGAILFMHGFSQMPKSYFRTIQDLVAHGYLVVAPYGGREAIGGEAGIDSPKVRAIVASLEKEAGGSGGKGLAGNLRYATQLALKQDGQQCIKFLGNPEKATMKYYDSNDKTTLATYLPKGVKRIGVCGHSMGAGLSFSLGAEYPGVAAIGVMAPMIYLEPAFDPLKEVDKAGFKDKEVLLLSGGLDFIVFAKDVRRLWEEIKKNAAKRGNTVTYENLPWYFHTSFEDQLTLGDVTLTAAVSVALGTIWWLTKLFGVDGEGPAWEVWVQRIELLLFVAYVYLVDVRPKFIQGTESRDKLVKFFTKNV